ncbi:hypothetical protein HY522_06210, partial [bacterium]|nr:hypothetical protein [bacterium]
PEDAPVLDKVYYGDLDKNMETILEGIETAADAAEPRLGARQDWLPKKRWKLHQRVALANYWDEQKREEKIEKRLRAIMNGERVPEAVFESHSYDHGMPTYFSSEEELLKAEAKYAAKAWNDGEWQCWAFLANRHDMRMEKLEKQKLKSGIRGSAMEDVGAGDASHEGTAAIHDVSYSALDERVDQISNEYPQGTVSGEGEILSSHPFQVRATQWGIPFISEGEAKKYGYAP